MSRPDFKPANPNQKVVVHSPKGEAVECTIPNAHDLVRLSGYFWAAEDAVAAKAVAAAKVVAAAEVEESAEPVEPEETIEPIERNPSEETSKVEFTKTTGRKSNRKTLNNGK